MFTRADPQPPARPYRPRLDLVVLQDRLAQPIERRLGDTFAALHLDEIAAVLSAGHQLAEPLTLLPVGVGSKGHPGGIELKDIVRLLVPDFAANRAPERLQHGISKAFFPERGNRVSSLLSDNLRHEPVREVQQQ